MSPPPLWVVLVALVGVGECQGGGGSRVIHNWDLQQDYCLHEKELPVLGRKRGLTHVDSTLLSEKNQRGECCYAPRPLIEEASDMVNVI